MSEFPTVEEMQGAYPDLPYPDRMKTQARVCAPCCVDCPDCGCCLCPSCGGDRDCGDCRCGLTFIRLEPGEYALVELPSAISMDQLQAIRDMLPADLRDRVLFVEGRVHTLKPESVA